MVRILLIAGALLPVASASWVHTGTGHPRMGDRIFDHYSASAEDVSEEECQAACAGLDQCIGVNYNDRYCWVFSEGCASPAWASALTKFQAAGYADCPTGKPDNFLLDDDETLVWYANPEYHTCDSFSSEDACAAASHCAWTSEGCTVAEKESSDVHDELAVEKAVAKSLHSKTAVHYRADRSADRRLQASGGPTAGDPITRFNGKSIQFWLPMDTNVKMISMDGFELFGMASKLTSLQSMQWFSDFTLKHKGQEIMHIGTQNVLKQGGLAALEAIAPPAKLGAGLPLRFLDVTTVEGDKRQQATVTGAYFLSQGLVIADVSHDQKYLIYQLNKETVTIKEAANPDSVVFEFHAAKANKFTDKVKQLKHLHLDMSFGDLATKSITGGILPQIWGIQARTPEVEQMLHRPY